MADGRLTVAARRSAMLAAHRSALEAVNAGNATRIALASLAGLAGEPHTVIAIGKAAVPMARAAMEVMPDQIVGGVAVDAEGGGNIGPIEVLRGDHPYPSDDSLAAGERVAGAARTAPGTVLFLVSGGASSLVEFPAGDLTGDDLATTAGLLLEGGVDITRLNVVRRSLSQLKGGGLRRMVDARATTTLIVSDVIGDDPRTIASGPTVRPDADSHTSAAEVLRDAGVWERVPAAVRDHLAQTTEEAQGWPYDDVVQIIATGAIAADAAAASLASYAEVELHADPIEGDAVDAARSFTAAKGPAVHVGYGETTVDVRGTGVGGRNQHAALRAALDIHASEGVFAALSTDGIDGASHAAGAIVDGETISRCRSAGIDPELELGSCNSTPALEASGDVVVTGPTGTNVGDVWIWWP